MICFTTFASVGPLGEKVILYGKDLKFTPLKSNSKLLFNICPVEREITLCGDTLEPNAPIAAPDNAACTAA